MVSITKCLVVSAVVIMGATVACQVADMTNHHLVGMIVHRQADLMTGHGPHHREILVITDLYVIIRHFVRF